MTVTHLGGPFAAFSALSDASESEEGGTLTRTNSYYSLTTTTDQEYHDQLTPTPSSDNTSIVYGGYQRNEHKNAGDEITFRDCRPLNIRNALRCKDGHYFAVHFEDCSLGFVNFDNCLMINVLFENCTFRGTTFSNIFLKNVVLKDCHFESYIWQNDTREDVTLQDEKRFEITDMCEEIPKQIADPDWLTNEFDGTNDLIREIEAEKQVEAETKRQAKQEANAQANAKVTPPIVKSDAEYANLPVWSWDLNGGEGGLLYPAVVDSTKAW